MTESATKNRAAQIQTQKDHAVERLTKRLAHETKAAGLERDAAVLAYRGDRMGASLLAAKAAREREQAESFR